MSPETMRTTKPVAEQLRELREARGLSQSELARRTGMHQPYISAVEAGRRKSITLPMLEKWVRALGGRLIVLD